MSEKPDALTSILDRAYAEWREAGFPAGEGVVHLWEFQRIGLWQAPDGTCTASSGTAAQ